MKTSCLESFGRALRRSRKTLECRLFSGQIGAWLGFSAAYSRQSSYRVGDALTISIFSRFRPTGTSDRL